MLSRNVRDGRRGVIKLGAAGDADLSAVHTWQDFAAYLQRIQQQSGRSLPDLKRAGERLARSGRGYRPLPTSTVSDALNGKRRIKKDLLVSLLEALSVPVADRASVLDTWQRLTATIGEGPPGAGRVDEASPGDLGVHPAIQVPGESGRLPEYVERDFDQQLRDLITAGISKGTFVLLMGGSSCGKTRSLYEAVSLLVPEWWLVQPATTREINGLVQMPTENTVLWLDEFHRFLDTDAPLRPENIRALRRAGMIIVGTVWHNHYHSRKRLGHGDGNDVYAEDRKLMDLAELIPIPEALSPGERRLASDLARDDKIIRAALSVADFGFTQVLAAGRDLVLRWDHAPNPYCKALITAAADARRLGVQGALSVDMLTTAISGYLSRSHRVRRPQSWLELGLAEATSKLYGDVSPLSAVAPEIKELTDPGEDYEREPHYSIADYLTQHIGRIRRIECPPDSLWSALTSGTHDLDDLRRLASAALVRMRYADAERILRRLHRAGDDGATTELITLLRRQDRLDDAIAVADASLAAEPSDTQRRDRRLGLGRLRNSADQLRERATSDPSAEDHLTELLADGGKAAALRAQAAEGSRAAAEDLAELLAERGCVNELRDLAEHGHEASAALFAGLLASLGRTDELHARADAGDPTARLHLARPATGYVGPDVGTLDRLRVEADSGKEKEKAAAELTELLFAAGDRAGLLGEVHAGTYRAAERYLALLTASPDVSRRDVRDICAFGLYADGRPARPEAAP